MAFEPDGPDGGHDLGRGVEEGQVAFVEQRANGELAGRLQIQEGDPGEVDKNRPAVGRDVGQRPLQLPFAKEIQLPPQLDQ